MWTQFEFAASGGSVLPAGQEIRKLPFGEPAKPMTGKEPIAVKAGGILSGNFGRAADDQGILLCVAFASGKLSFTQN